VQQRSPAGTDSYRRRAGGDFYQYTNVCADRTAAYRSANQYTGPTNSNIDPYDQTNGNPDNTDVHRKIR
jgi:hypothetical protein